MKPSSSFKILVVDDDPMVRETLQRALAVEGYTVEVVQGGAEALAVFEDRRFDLVITDFEMADMNGHDLAAGMKAQVPEQKIVMLTGYEEQAKALGHAVPVDLILGKPFDLREFQAAIKRMLGR
jgi:two-component system response regulator MprA